MNTREINNSAWPINHYIFTTIPLTVVSVLLPLVFLRLFKELIRLDSAVRAHNSITWIIVLLIFLLNLIVDIYVMRQVEGQEDPSVLPLISFYITSLIFSSYPTSFTLRVLASYSAFFRRKKLTFSRVCQFIVIVSRTTSWDFLAFYLCYILYFILTFTSPVAVTEIIPFGLYLSIPAWRWVWMKHKSKRSKWRSRWTKHGNGIRVTEPAMEIAMDSGVGYSNRVCSKSPCFHFAPTCQLLQSLDRYSTEFTIRTTELPRLLSGKCAWLQLINLTHVFVLARPLMCVLVRPCWVGWLPRFAWMRCRATRGWALTGSSDYRHGFLPTLVLLTGYYCINLQ
jgi:hypothetical protein